MLEDLGVGLRVGECQARAPFDIGDEGGPELGVVRKPSVVGCEAQQRGEAKALIRCDPEPAVVAQHALVSAQLLGVPGRAAEHLAPPGSDVRAVLLADAAGEERRQQLVAFDTVVEGVDQLPKCRFASGPLIQGGRLVRGAGVHRSNRIYLAGRESLAVATMGLEHASAGRLKSMALELYMVGVIVADMERAVEFYRRLGLEIPEESEKQEHVEVKMGEMTFFLSTRRANAKWDPEARDPSGGYRIILEFYLETREALDAKYAEMTGFGYEPHCAPYDVTPDLRFAMVDDPDGNTILLSASTVATPSESGSIPA